MRHLVINLCVFITLLICLGCGSAGDKPSADTSSLAQSLTELCDTLPQYVAPHDGDSATFTAYSRAACGGPRLTEYESRPGRYERWPLELGYSWDQLNSSGTKTKARSKNSPDMYLAIMALAWYSRDLDALEDIRNWGHRRGWAMGDGRFAGADTLLSPNLRNTLAEMIYQLGGDNSADRYIPTYWSSCDDYECWNLGVHLALRLQLYGRLGGQARQQLAVALAHQPHNPLLLSVSRRASLLHPPILHPRTNQPGKCDLWPYRRNDLRPLCPDGWPGDWAFTAKTIVEMWK